MYVFQYALEKIKPAYEIRIMDITTKFEEIWDDLKKLNNFYIKMVVNRYRKNPGYHNKWPIFGYTSEKQLNRHNHTHTHKEEHLQAR